MGRAIKRLMIVAAALFVLGIILCSISVVAGVNTSNVTLFGKDTTNYVDFNQVYTEKISALDVDFGYGLLYVKEGEAFRVEAKNVPENKFSATVEKDGTLKVNIKNHNRWISLDGFPFFLFNTKDKRQTSVTIYIPKDTTLKNCNIDISAGKVDLDGISAESGEFHLSAGQLIGNKITLIKNSKLDLSAGSMRLSNVELNDCEMDLSAGELDVNGRITGRTEASVSAGSIKIATDLEEKDYNYECDASAGNIKINGSNAKHKDKDNDADNSFELDCTAGEIKVTTK